MITFTPPTETDEYKTAYQYANTILRTDPTLLDMESGKTSVDWDTIRDRLADAFVDGHRSAMGKFRVQ